MHCLTGSPMSHPVQLASWVRAESRTLLQSLNEFARTLDAGGDYSSRNGAFLDFLFEKGLLPTYAFPTDLASFVVEGWGERQGEVVEKEKPQLATNQALSDYQVVLLSSTR